MRTLDCRDMRCPKPVSLVQKSLEELPDDAALVVIVNNEMSCDNIITYAQNKGYFVKTEHQGSSIDFITITKSFTCNIDEHLSREKTIENHAVIITHETVGSGIHGQILMQEFLDSFLSQKTLPAKIILVNQAVKLACMDNNSAITKTLRKIEQKGVKIYSIISSLKEFELQKKHHVGRKMNIFEMQETMLNCPTSTI